MSRSVDGDVLRFTTAGSVDDGKSTLIGRLLYDGGSVHADQLTAVVDASRQLGEDRVNLALLTDGLRAERTQKITIDVAYRYFSTPRRTFIIADTPGHEQYTRNMVTGASTADAAVILVDATKGPSTQSRRHAFVAALLGIPHAVIAINKMDAVGCQQPVFERIVQQFSDFTRRLAFDTVTFVPVSALDGDNVVHPSRRLSWYAGDPLLRRLETLPARARTDHASFRFPVQYVIRPNQRFRGYAGSVASGRLSRGDEVVVLPGAQQTRIRAIETPRGPVETAAAGDAVVLVTTDELDIDRGHMLVRAPDMPVSTSRVDAYVCWMHHTDLAVETPFVLQHTTRRVQARITDIEHAVDIDTMAGYRTDRVRLNDIVRVRLETAQPIFVDSYETHPGTGSFILIDPRDNVTAAAGMIRSEVRDVRRSSVPVSPNVVWEGWNVPREQREQMNGHLAAVVWLTGLSGAGKTTLARSLERFLLAQGCRTFLLDGDHLRHGLCGDLGFRPEDRTENIRRAGEVAKLAFQHGCIVLCAFVSPYRRDRERVRALIPEGRFIEVLVTARPETLRARDAKHLYARASVGEIQDFTGLSAPYEPPVAAELTLDTDAQSIDAATALIAQCLQAKRIAPLHAGRAAE